MGRRNTNKYRKFCSQIAVSVDTRQSQIIIHQKEINEYHATLGCKKTMIGCSKDHHISLQKKSDDVGIKLKNGEFNRRQGWMSLSGSFIPSLKYSLPGKKSTKYKNYH
jgi:hypothetical protein